MLHALKNAFFCGIFSLLSMPAFSQDPMVSQVPVDARMRAVDSIPLQSFVQKENLSDPAADLYPDWNNVHINVYKNVHLPEEYKIDLRGFYMPTPSRKVTSNYGYRRRFRRQHFGIDVKVFIGDTIYAAFDGKVRVVTYQRSGYGNVVVIRHPNGLETIYGHLSKHLVKEKQIVKAGDPIGLGGNTGRSYGSHLHFETRLVGEYIDPALMFDFPNQDVTADFYIYRKNGNNSLLGKHTGSHKSSDLASNELKETPLPKTAQRSSTATTTSHIHKVRKGENLSKIAQKYHISIDRLCSLNGLKKTSTLRIGQILKVS